MDVQRQKKYYLLTKPSQYPLKVPTPYTTQPPCHNCVAILGDNDMAQINIHKFASQKVEALSYRPS